MPERVQNEKEVRCTDGDRRGYVLSVMPDIFGMRDKAEWRMAVYQITVRC